MLKMSHVAYRLVTSEVVSQLNATKWLLDRAADVEWRRGLVQTNRSEHSLFQWRLLFLAALFALFAFVLAAELNNSNGEEDEQNREAHNDPHAIWVH